jgi:hypothetical protein
MVLKGFELSDDDELPDEQDPGQKNILMPREECAEYA